jgi:HSP20 family protein
MSLLNLPPLLFAPASTHPPSLPPLTLILFPHHSLCRDVFGDDFFAPFWRGGFDTSGALMPAQTGGSLSDLLPSRHIHMDISETDSAYAVKADLPGVEKENISVTADNNVLRINVEKKEEKKEEGTRWHRYERSSQFLARAIRLPETADMDNMKAQYHNGVLSLEIPKREEAKKTKQITIE